MYLLIFQYFLFNKKGLDNESLILFLQAKKINKEKKYIPLRLEKYEEFGWSVIADSDIPQNTYICEYAGNVLKSIYSFKTFFYFL